MRVTRGVKINHKPVFALSLVTIQIIAFVGAYFPAASLFSSNLSNGGLRPRASDILGDDFDFFENIYIEQVNPEVYGDRVLIHNSILTDDNSFMAGIDFMDPVFEGVSLFFTFTNGIENPLGIDPISALPPASVVSNQNLVGLLYWNGTQIPQDISKKIATILERLQGFLQLEIVPTTPMEDPTGLVVPFFGFPQVTLEATSTVFSQLIGIMPDDGYFRHLHAAKSILLGANFLTTHFFEGTVFYLQDLDTLDDIQDFLDNSTWCTDLGVDYRFYLDIVGKALENPICSSLAALSDMARDLSDESPANVSGQLVEDYAEEFDIGDRDSVEDEIKSYNGLFLWDLVHEPVENPITTVQSGSKFVLDLFKALNLSTDGTLQPSTHSFDSALGWYSGIGMILRSATVLNVSRDLFNPWYEKLLPFRYALLLSDEDRKYQDYFKGVFRLTFSSEGIESRMSVVPEYTDPGSDDILDFFEYMIPYGFPVLPGVFMIPLENFNITFQLQEEIPILRVTKTFPNGQLNSTGLSLGDIPYTDWTTDYNLTLDIEITNTGDIDAWGLPIRVLGKYGLTNEAPGGSINAALETLGVDTESMFDVDAIPRYFPVDPFGDGLYIGYSPDLTNISQALPYSPAYSEAVFTHAVELEGMTPWSLEYIYDYAERYNRTTSIYNPDNWVIHPGETIQLQYSHDLIRPNFTLVDQLPLENNYTHEILRSAAVKFSNEGGLNQYFTKSNALLVTREHNFTTHEYRIDQVITAFANMTHQISNLGQNNLFNLSVVNPGRLSVFNLSLSLPQCGLLNQSVPARSTFEREGNQPELVYNLSKLVGNESITNATFEFFIPNSLQVDQAEIRVEWNFSCPDTNELVENTTLDFPSNTTTLKANDVILFASLTKGGVKSAPFRPQLKITSTPSIIGVDHVPGDSFKINYILRNTGTCNVSNISIPLKAGTNVTTGLRVSSTTFPSTPVATLSPGAEFRFDITYTMVNYSGHMVPALGVFCNESDFLVLAQNNMSILGVPSLSARLELSRSWGYQGKDLLVKIVLKNEANITLRNITVDATRCYDTRQFGLKAGTLRRVLDYIPKNSEMTVNFTLTAKTFGAFTLEECEVSTMMAFLVIAETTPTKFVSIPLGLILGIAGVVGIIGVLIFYVKKHASSLDDYRPSTVIKGHETGITAENSP